MEKIKNMNVGMKRMADKIVNVNLNTTVKYYYNGKLYKFLPYKFDHCIAGLMKDPVRFMLCAYYVRNEPTKPKLINYDPKTDTFQLYEVGYANSYNSLILCHKGEWKYEDKFGNKKIGWRVITPDQFGRIFCVEMKPKYIMVTESIPEEEQMM